MVLTIGHSNHDYRSFLELLRGAGADTVIDVRSVPYSRRVPHFNGKALQLALPQAEIEYHYLGQRLGGRPLDPHLYRNGRADYQRMAEQPDFLQGLEAVEALERTRTPVLMCAERDPLDCHRCLLLARVLAARGAALAHVLADGSTQSQQAIDDRLLAVTHAGEADLFATRAQRLAMAYAQRAGAVAYAETSPALRPPATAASRRRGP